MGRAEVGPEVDAPLSTERLAQQLRELSQPESRLGKAARRRRARRRHLRTPTKVAAPHALVGRRAQRRPPAAAASPRLRRLLRIPLPFLLLRRRTVLPRRLAARAALAALATAVSVARRVDPRYKRAVEQLAGQAYAARRGASRRALRARAPRARTLATDTLSRGATALALDCAALEVSRLNQFKWRRALALALALSATHSRDSRFRL